MAKEKSDIIFIIVAATFQVTVGLSGKLLKPPLW
jgi:hypothetical protein